MLPLILRNSDQGASEHNPTNLIVRKRWQPDVNEWNNQEVVSRIIIGISEWYRRCVLWVRTSKITALNSLAMRIVCKEGCQRN